MQSFSAIISSPIGNLGISLASTQLAKLTFLSASHPLIPAQDPVTQSICAELNNYFLNSQHKFNLRFELKGTAFQQKVWYALQGIPSGKTVTYLELARRLNTGPRAIGNACRTNPLPIIIPCHRVISRQGLGGYAGEIQGNMLGIKQWLLRHENIAEELFHASRKKL